MPDSRVIPGAGALTDEPRWSQTCLNGHFDRTRADQRPRLCPACGAPFAITDDARAGSKRTSGDAALHTLGDGRRRNRRRVV